MGVAPKGAFPVAQEKPAKSQGAPCSYDIDASPIRIERMLRSVFSNEQKIAQLQKLAPVVEEGKRYCIKLAGESKLRYVTSASVGEELAKATRERDSHLDEIRHVIDYALTTDAYEDVSCSDCEPWTMPLDPLEFIAVAATAEPPSGSTSMCKTCLGVGTVRERKKDKESKAAFKRISHFKRSLEITQLCAKVRYRSSDHSEAYARLEEMHDRLITKFGNEQQTTLESDDAAQGARMGIMDAAMRYDPTRPENAAFGTVAHNWAYRNSRERKRSDARAGIHASSLDDKFGANWDGTKVEQVASSNGALSSFDQSVSSDDALVIDMRNKISCLPKAQRRVVMSIYGGDTVATAAKALKMSRGDVELLRDKAFATLRDSLSGYVDVVCD